MKSRNKKQTSILSLVAILVLVAVITGLAYVATTTIGQDQSTKVEQEVQKQDGDTQDDEKNEVSGEDETVKDEVSEDEALKDEESEDEALKDEESEDEVLKDETSEDEVLKDETSEDEVLKDETSEDEAVKDETSEDGAVKDETSEDEITQDVKEEKLGFFDKNKIKLGLDLQGGVNIVYEPKLEGELSAEELSETMKAAQSLIQKRLTAKGYTEAEVAIEGTKHLRVDIPGVEDPQKAIDEIGAAGMLRFIDVQTGEEIVTGKNVKNAKAGFDSQNNDYFVAIEMDAEGAKAFSEYTEHNIGNLILIMLDETWLSMPKINAHITDGSGIISGQTSPQEAQDLANSINAGALPFTLEAITSDGVGPELGMDALQTSLLAGIIGFIAILIFMIVVYRGCGIVADIALVLYVGLVILTLTIMNSTLTLAGIAGILLSIGMAVDANVIIFARIKEEMSSGRSVRASVDAGFSKAFSAILDGNITTLIAGAVLYMFGTGLIRSFATTLMVGIVISMFTALVITRTLLKSFVGMGIKKPSFYANIKKQGKEA